MTRTPPEEYDRWLARLTREVIRDMFVAQGCTRVMIKPLAERQDNDKNQIYVGPDLNDVAFIPSGDVVASVTSSDKPGSRGKTKFTTPVDWVWLSPQGESPAPDAKLIFYPQYPEVRLSGLLAKSSDPPRSLYARSIRGQEAGRHLLIGIDPNATRVWAMILPPEAIALADLMNDASEDAQGVFHLWELDSETATGSTRLALLEHLHAVHLLGWVPGQKLGVGGLQPYVAQNAHGYTLEALSGVRANGVSGPDYLGWELKAHRGTTPLTLFTPSPTGGAITHYARELFMREFGRLTLGDTLSPLRYDFTGKHLVGQRSKTTRLTLSLHGWDGGRELEPDGGLQLLSEDGVTAMEWSFAHMMTLWKAKHSQTVYVPCRARRVADGQEFWFGDKVLLCTGTSFLHLLAGFSQGAVFYDPGLKIEWVMGARGPRWRPKSRHQFRTALRDVGPLYDDAQWVTLPTA